MALTTLDQNTALIIIDLQRGVVTMPTVHPAEYVVARASALATAFRARGLPVVLVNVNGGQPGRTETPSSLGQPPAGWTELVPELGQQPEDLLVTKDSRSAFANTGLDDQLKGLGVTQVVLAGISTSSGVESSARAAHEHGYNVTIATDATTDTSVDLHEHSISRVFPRLGETGTTEQIIALLNRTRA